MVEYYIPIEQDRKDFGTPAITGEDVQTVTLSIDGWPVTVPQGTSVMRAASTLNIQIPKLCATDSLDAFGSCRLCVVEIEGMRGKPASCTTPVAEGMVVTTENSALKKLRRNVMELYISDHPLDCLTCAVNGDCELQDMAGAVGLRDVRYGFDGENHLNMEKDTSNPYFTFDTSKCIVCSRCVRACEDIQGQHALTVNGRAFESRIVAGDNNFMESECVSCGACVQACPTAALTENSVIEQGTPSHYRITTCAYCGVGCSFRAEMRGDQLVRMVPNKDGKANQGHSCVKGRFAFGYATHKDRMLDPMIRESIDQPWRKVSWDEAITFAANRLTNIRDKHGVNALGGITSSRCTNEETYLVQKLVRGAFGTNNVDTCARVCHSPTGYGLKTTLGESAGTQTFDSVQLADVVIVIGANPTDGHPVFASQLKRRLRAGAKLIVIDPREIDLVNAPHVRAQYHLQLRPGTNVAVLNALAHVIITEGLEDLPFIEERCDIAEYNKWREFIAQPSHAPEVMESETGIPAMLIREAARLYGKAGNGAIYYGLGVTEHSQGSSAVMGIANLAMATGNLGREGVGVNPLRGQNNVQGSCDMGSFPHELPGYRHVSDPAVRALFESEWGVPIDSEPGLRIPNMFDAAIAGRFKALYVQGEDIAQSDPNTQHVEAALSALECLIVQDIFLNETAKFAHVFLPGATFLEKDGTFTNAERRISPVRKVMAPLSGKGDWEATVALSNALGFEMNYSHPSEIMDEIARLTPTFHGVSYEKLDELGSIQWPCNEEAPDGTPTMHIGSFVKGKGSFVVTEYVASEERVNKRFPLILTTGRILSQYNVGAQTRRTDNSQWHTEDVLEIHPLDAEDRGITDGTPVSVGSRAGAVTLQAKISERMQPGVVYTTFHHPVSGTNVITTENSDWATNCPEYKVTAVQVKIAVAQGDWQTRFQKFDEEQQAHLSAATQDGES
ncbi:formate dehydrogenase subunit alpha [Enterovibrio norvegicus FF-33]|uniref:Formate dehydrogenase subunit alpha n=1 Tax=Enterovibrio norvegicus FF-454 TaxID=1185651 RepID=A0A1E5BW20_9GAMM|nr:formate dehydrogenase subunit alpha [Enterovibrio norvegicus]OEE57441.1 formate dehydrogenase subunit alpha [Enterovibrio norvegicus FF-454]OEE67289.1 formate dehydrogenase subunit alpha [Enterovibrio norvegicus FF-33]OEE88979.1 formate dehydrogenase subunit alpha [Enterovibrio norvegicus FF-162]